MLSTLKNSALFGVPIKLELSHSVSFSTLLRIIWPYNNAMDYRAELVRLIMAGTQKPEVYAFFIGYDFEPWEVDQLLHDCGTHLPRRRPNHDGISPERRRELQALSTSQE
jgi:hypothetical protein